MERFFRLEEPYIRYLTVLFEGSPEDRFKTEGIHSDDEIPHFDSDSDTEKISTVSGGSMPTAPLADRVSSKPKEVEPAFDEPDTDDDTGPISDDSEL